MKPSDLFRYEPKPDYATLVDELRAVGDKSDVLSVGEPERSLRLRVAEAIEDLMKRSQP